MNFITGASGLVGANITAQLLQQGQTVKALKRESTSLLTIENTFKIYFKEHAQAQLNKIIWCDGDITDYDSFETHIKDCDYVYHCAALVSFHDKDFDRLKEINQYGTANVVNACLSNNIKKLLYTSSVAAFPNISEMVTEEDVWKDSKQKSQYAITKYLAENEVWRGIEEGLEAAIINPGIILGPGQTEGNGSVFFNLVKDGLKFYTTGSSGFVDVRDVASVAVQLTESTMKNERFILVGENSSYKNVFELIAKKYNLKVPSIEAGKNMLKIAGLAESIKSILTGNPPRINKTTINASCEQATYNNSKIKKALNFEFKALENTIEYCCEGY